MRRYKKCSFVSRSIESFRRSSAIRSQEFLAMPPLQETPTAPRRRKNVVNRMFEDRSIERVSSDEYRDKVRDVYAGPKGAILATCSFLSLHKPLGERLAASRKFDLQGCGIFLTWAAGPGRLPAIYRNTPIKTHGSRASICRPKCSAEPKQFEKRLAAVMSWPIFRDCRWRRKRSIASLAAMCSSICPIRGPGWRNWPRDGSRRQDAALDDRRQFRRGLDEPNLVLSHLQSAGAMRTCHELGLIPRKELWFTQVHKLFRAGGICVELVKQA